MTVHALSRERESCSQSDCALSLTFFSVQRARFFRLCVWVVSVISSVSDREIVVVWKLLTKGERRQGSGENLFSFNSAKLGGGLCEGASARFSKKSIECRLLFETGWFVVVGCGSSSGAPFSLSLCFSYTTAAGGGGGFHRWRTDEVHAKLFFRYFE